MSSFRKQFQQRRPIAHARNGPHTVFGIRVVASKDKGGLIRSFVELPGEPIQLFVSEDALS